jgi:hypothetical protein
MGMINITSGHLCCFDASKQQRCPDVEFMPMLHQNSKDVLL